MITWWPFVDHLVTTWWPLVDHLMTTFDYLVTSQWPLIDHLVTTWWLFGDHLVTIWWPLYQLFFSSSSVLHSVTTWWLLSTFVQFLFFAPVSTAHPPAFGAYWYFRQFCHDIYFLKALSDMYTIKSKSREIYTILPYDDITIIIIIIILASIIIIIEIFFGHPRKTFFLCPKKRTKLHWGDGGGRGV